VSTPASRVAFGGLMRSKWIKLWSLRSTWWLYAITIVLFAGIAGLLALSSGDWTSSYLNPDNASFGSMAAEQIAQAKASAAASAGAQVSQEWIRWDVPVLTFAQLVVSVLGVLGIAGEYQTGAIKSTFAAAPKRTAALFSKVLVIFLASVIIGAIGIAVATATSWGVLAAHGWPIDAGDPYVWRTLGGAIAYLGFAGAFGSLIGAIVRVQAGAIPTAIGFVLILPTIASLLAGMLDAAWLYNVGQFLPYSLGNDVSTYPFGEAANAAGGASASAGDVEGPWIDPVHDGFDPATGQPDPSRDSGKISVGPAAAAVALAAWLVVGWVFAQLVTKRRDV